jgi:hypothetical protein
MVVHNGSEIGNVKQDQKIAVASKKFILRHKISSITRFRKVPIPSWSLEAKIWCLLLQSSISKAVNK